MIKIKNRKNPTNEKQNRNVIYLILPTRSPQTNSWTKLNLVIGEVEEKKKKEKKMIGMQSVPMSLILLQPRGTAALLLLHLRIAIVAAPNWGDISENQQRRRLCDFVGLMMAIISILVLGARGGRGTLEGSWQQQRRSIVYRWDIEDRYFNVRTW